VHGARELRAPFSFGKLACQALVNIHDARRHSSRLVKRTAAGEEIVIAKNGNPVARLTDGERNKRGLIGAGLTTQPLTIFAGSAISPCRAAADRLLRYPP
jgi:prevent-host-death family protein